MLASGTATLESSTATAGAATERSSRTANGFEVLAPAHVGVERGHLDAEPAGAAAASVACVAGLEY